jgi:Tol biopolymer transport system component
MQGDGCYPQLVMSHVSDSPAWSPNGQRIAAGCENHSRICLIDATKIPQTPSSTASLPEAQLVAQKLELPEICSRYGIHSISWSAQMTKLAVVCGGYFDSGPTYLYVVEIGAKAHYGVILTDREILRAVWSPADDRIAVSTLRGEIYLVNADGSHRTSLIAHWGWSPEWSPDGRRIAFVKPPEDDDEFLNEGLAIMNLEETETEWVYPPPPKGSAIMLGCGDLRYDCRLAWSPDSGCISVGARYGAMFNWQIFRLNIKTGNILQLTTESNSGHNYEPDWGP